MNPSKLEVIALWLIGLSVPAFLFGALTFGGMGVPAWVVLGFGICTIFWIVAFPLGVILLLASQIMKWFGKRS